MGIGLIISLLASIEIMLLFGNIINFLKERYNNTFVGNNGNNGNNDDISNRIGIDWTTGYSNLLDIIDHKTALRWSNVYRKKRW